MSKKQNEEKTERIKCSYAIRPHIFHSLKLYASMQGRDMSAIIEEGLLAVIPSVLVAQVAKLMVENTLPEDHKEETKRKRVQAVEAVSEAEAGIDAAGLLAHVEAVLQEVTQDAFVEAVGRHYGKEYKGGGASWRGWRDTLAGGSLPRNYRAVIAALEELGCPIPITAVK